MKKSRKINDLNPIEIEVLRQKAKNISQSVTMISLCQLNSENSDSTLFDLKCNCNDLIKHINNWKEYIDVIDIEDVRGV